MAMLAVGRAVSSAAACTWGGFVILLWCCLWGLGQVSSTPLTLTHGARGAGFHRSLLPPGHFWASEARPRALRVDPEQESCG